MTDQEQDAMADLLVNFTVSIAATTVFALVVAALMWWGLSRP
jgi:hypothetical protein